MPFIRSFDGQTVEIEFEITTVHVTCNDQETPYRSLVDMSEVLGTAPPVGKTLHVSVDFDGAKLERSLELECPDGQDCNATGPGQLLPERGLYVTPARAYEGLAVARQNQTSVLYPLVYDESGKAVWLFSAAPFVDGTFFAQLTRLEGGDCFDCESTGTEAQRTEAGRISVFTERPDTIWVKLNDRPFSEYQKLVYGYEVFNRAEGSPLVDLAGRWALSENHGTDPPLGDLSTVLPPTFDMALETDANRADPAAVVYRVTSITGRELGQLVCELNPMTPGNPNGCSFIDPTDQAEPLLIFYPEGPATLSIVYGRPLPAIGTPPGGTAVRLD